jgi:hypothetical protein
LDFDWKNGFGIQVGTAEDLNNIGQDVYTLSVIDINGCSFETTAQVSEQGAPIITLVDVVNAGCLNDGEIDIDITSTNAATVLWSNAEITEDVTNLSVGTYFVNVEDDVTSCASNLVIEVSPDLPTAIEVCLVSVDTVTGSNLVVWEKPVATNIDKFIIYRETAVSGEYLVVDSSDYNVESTFTDSSAFPNLRSWRYKISVLNDCGIESELSESHKTIHIGVSLALGGGYNLFWDDYEGFAYGTFDIWRHTDIAGWELIQPLSTSNFSYFDNPSTSAGLNYFIAVTPPSLCQSTKAQDHNSSRSNNTSSVTDSGSDTDGINENNSLNIIVSPNPSTDKFNVRLSDSNAEHIINVYDLSGKLIYNFKSTYKQFSIDMTSYESGIYILEVKNEQFVSKTQIVKY